MSVALSTVVRLRLAAAASNSRTLECRRELCPRHTARIVIAGRDLRAMHDVTYAYIHGEVEGSVHRVRSVDRDGRAQRCSGARP